MGVGVAGEHAEFAHDGVDDGVPVGVFCQGGEDGLLVDVGLVEEVDEFCPGDELFLEDAVAFLHVGAFHVREEAEDGDGGEFGHVAADGDFLGVHLPGCGVEDHVVVLAFPAFDGDGALEGAGARDAHFQDGGVEVLDEPCLCKLVFHALLEAFAPVLEFLVDDLRGDALLDVLDGHDHAGWHGFGVDVPGCFVLAHEEVDDGGVCLVDLHAGEVEPHGGSFEGLDLVERSRVVLSVVPAVGVDPLHLEHAPAQSARLQFLVEGCDEVVRHGDVHVAEGHVDLCALERVVAAWRVVADRWSDTGKVLHGLVPH